MRGSPELMRFRISLLAGAVAAAALCVMPPTASYADDPANAGTDDVIGVARAAKPRGALKLPTPLSKEDAARYVRIFALQQKGQWARADGEIATLTDRVLLGHVKAQRYLHPTRYRSRYPELADWLRHYADHPDARQIYKLALRRKPRSAAMPEAPRAVRPAQYSESIDIGAGRSALRTSEAAATIQRHVRGLVRRDRLTAAEEYVDKKEKSLGPAQTDLARARVAAGWFYYGNDGKAFALAQAAAKRSGGKVPSTHWYAGLAAYRLGNVRDAVAHFEAMAAMDGLSDWQRSAAAFWAARSSMVARKPERVSGWLAAAAKHHRTFYGILGRRLLGIPSPFRWNSPVLDNEDAASVLRNPLARRALALIQAGQHQRAEDELRRLARSGDPDMRIALVAIADEVGLPSLALRAAAALEGENGRGIPRGLYPVPRWKPEEGFTVDRALIFAVMRQESAFNARARSYAGARGLMQLMPATAGYMANTRFRGSKRNDLYDPELNMALGQKYLRYLIQHENIEGDLFMLAAAYNGGPGNLAKWKRRVERRTDDPLLFIESIPSNETRNFIERVLANLWIYRERLGQESPSLDAIAEGRRPVYKSQDRSQLATNDDGRH